jgi:hypothetical protein
MATSKVQICNSALIKLGVEKISSFSETSKAAVLCSEQYDKVRKKVLRSHIWDFALKRQELSKLVSVPLFDYDSQFALPTDCLRPVETHLGTQVDFVVEGKYLLMNSTSCKLLYISDIEDVSFFDTYFEEALAYWIAADLAYPLKQDLGLSDRMKQNALMEIADARSFDAQQGRLSKMLQEDVWLNSRISGTGTP